MQERETATARLRRAANQAPMLDAQTEHRLIEEFRAGSQRALDRLLASHLRLVLAISRRYAGHGIALEDLISEGTLGLVEAARRFELDRQNRFATYAAWWVRAHVRRYALANRRIVSAPSTRAARKVIASLRKTEREIQQQTGEAADRSAVAQALGVEESDVAMVEAAMGGRDVIIGPHDDGTVFDVPADTCSPEQLTAEEEAREFNRRAVQQALHGLTDREQEIVRRRFLEEESATLAVLGESLGLSRERVRQLEKRAQRKLKSALLECVA